MRSRYKVDLFYKSSFIFIVLCALMIIFCENSYAEELVLGSGMNYIVEHSINATLYDTNQYGDGGRGQILNAEGINIEKWSYNESKFLQVNIMLANNLDEVHIVEIKLPTPFYAVSDVTEVPAGFSKVEMIKNPDLSINGGTGTYHVYKGSGTIRYYLKPNMTRATIRLELRYDENLWDKLGNSPLTPEGVSPITVSLGHENSLENGLLGQYSAMVHVAKVTSGDRVMGYGNNYMKRTWNTTYWDARHDYFGYKDDKVRLMVYSTEINRLFIPKYYKKVTVDIDIPYYEKDGQKYYMDYDKDSLMFETVSHNVKFVKATVKEATKKHVTFYLDGCYVQDNTGIDIDLKWPQELVTDEAEIEFTGGRTWYKVISNTNEEVEGFTHSIGSIVLATKKYEDVNVWDYEQEVTISKMTNKTVTKLGEVFIRNEGTDVSTEKNIKMEFNKKHLVTTINLPADLKTKVFKVKYTLKDEDGKEVEIDGKNSWIVEIDNDKYNTNIIDNVYVRIYRGMLPTQHRKYYFDTISYTLAGINKKVNLYHDGDEIYQHICAGYFFGKLASTVVVGEKLNGTLTITSPKDSGINTIVYNYRSIVADDETVSYWVRDVKFSKPEIKAGDVVYTTGCLRVSSVFYRANSTWLHDMRFALLLPNGVSVDKSSIDVRTSVGNKVVDVVNMTKKKVDDINTLWIIDLNKDVCIGHFNEDLNPISTNGDRLFYSVKLVTDSDMEAVSIHSDKMVFFAGINQSNVIDICRMSYRTTDKWDLNVNGKTNDCIAGVAVSDRTSCSIAANIATLDIKDKITVIGDGTVQDGDATIKNRGDVLQYDLSIASRNDGVASSFEYYIPIVKKNSVTDDYLISSDASTAFDMQLIEKASIEGNDIYNIEYTTKGSLSYSQVRDLGESEWYTVQELSDDGKMLKDVTFIRITLKSGTITKGMDTTISVKMMYQGDEIYIDKGKYNAWRGCGYYDYDDGKKFVSGHFPAGGVTATVDVEEPPINNIVISTGEQISGGRMFYLYDIKGYKESKMSEPVEFVVERNHDSDVVTFAISISNEYMDTDSYIDKNYISIYDENHYKVEQNEDKVYKLKANRKYIMTISDQAFSVDKEDREYLYAHSYYAPLSDVEKLILLRASAFEEN